MHTLKPRPATPRGWSGGSTAIYFFLWEKEGLEPVQTLVPTKLPRYVFRRANGSFRYKRNVPKHLRPLIGKATLYRQLGDSYREAMQALPLVHARIEALLNDEADKSARERSLEIIRGALGDEVAEMVLAETVPEYSPIEDALNELGKDLHKKKDADRRGPAGLLGSP